MVKINDFLKMLFALRLPRSLVTKLGVCVQNKTERKLDSLHAFYYDVLLLTTAYSAYAVHFFLGQLPNMELMLLLLSPLCFFITELLYFCSCVTSVNITLFLTGCLRALNYMSKLDRLIYLYKAMFEKNPIKSSIRWLSANQDQAFRTYV